MTSYEWTVEFSAPLLFALPEQPPGAGPVGLGGNYFVANDRSRSAESVFAKQGFVRLKDVGGRLASRLTFQQPQQ